MKYINHHKVLIGLYLECCPSLEKWQARVLANRDIGNVILTSKKLKDEIKDAIAKSEFNAQAELKRLKLKIKTAQETGNLS